MTPAGCGVEQPKLWAGYILSKGAGGPPLYWHQDWLFWNDEKETRSETAYQLFGMIYLCQTRVHNGCLKVRTCRVSCSCTPCC